MSSEEFSQRIGKWRDRAVSPCFCIGGAYGLSAQVSRQCSESLSLSAFTFPHELALLLLLEQLYRAFCILHHHPYHK
jgi:23S rRNA (pseudouridine1915-N3)-methyltransferase